MIPILVLALTIHSYDHAPFTQPGIINTPPPITAESTADHSYLPASPFSSIEQST
jgi:hypothetical protein